MMERTDRSVIYLWAMLLCIGIVAVSSISVHNSGSWFNPLLTRHVLYVGVSIVAFVVGYAIPTNFFQQFYRGFWLLAFVLAVMVLIPFIGSERGGSRRWISLYFFTVQVSEWIKPLLVVFIAGYLANNLEVVQRSILSSCIVIGGVGVVLALVYLEPDFGTVAIVGLVTFGMLYFAKVRMSHLLVLGCVGLSGVGALLVLEPYRLARFTAYLSPWAEETEFHGSYQITNSLISFGRGELFGTGIGTGLQKTFTPAPHNDFIFATLAEETGLIGASVVLLLILALAYRCAVVGRNNMNVKEPFSGLFAYGVALLIGIQAMIHVGVNVNALPTKGLTLPFISFGGNSLVTFAGMLGMVFRIQTSNSTQP